MNVAAVLRLARAHGVDVPTALRPVLALSYLRQRWVDPGSGTRVAVDWAIRPAWTAAPGRPPASVPDAVTAVIEFKGDAPDIPAALRCVTRFGARRTAASKYFTMYARLHRLAAPDEGGMV